MDILDKLRDLHKQATTERSHYYVASCCNEAIATIERLSRIEDDLKNVFRAALAEPDGVSLVKRLTDYAVSQRTKPQ